MNRVGESRGNGWAVGDARETVDRS
jgi:hypothetical protein